MNRREVKAVAQEVAAGLVVAGVADLPLYGAAAPFVAALTAPAAVRGVEALRRRAERSVGHTLAIAASESGRQIDDLLEHLQNAPERAELLSAALRAAAFTSWADKLLMLGRSLASAATDSSSIDDELDFVAAVVALESRHMRLIAVLASTLADHGLPRDGIHVTPDDVAGGVWRAAQIEAVAPEVYARLDTLAPPLLASGVVLDRTGTRLDATRSGQFLALSDLGRIIVTRAKAQS